MGVDVGVWEDGGEGGGEDVFGVGVGGRRDVDAGGEHWVIGASKGRNIRKEKRVERREGKILQERVGDREIEFSLDFIFSLHFQISATTA